MQGMDHGAMGHDAMGGMQMGNMPGMGGMMGMGGQMGGMAMDLNDYDWDAYLANDRTLSDPEVVQVERGGRIRLRVINAAAATVFWIEIGGAEARLVAVDGHASSLSRHAVRAGNGPAIWTSRSTCRTKAAPGRSRPARRRARAQPDPRHAGCRSAASLQWRMPKRPRSTPIWRRRRLIALDALPDRPVDRGRC